MLIIEVACEVEGGQYSTSDQSAFQVVAQTVEALQHKRDELENAKDGKENQVRGITSMKQQKLLLGGMRRLTANKQFNNLFKL